MKIKIPHIFLLLFFSHLAIGQTPQVIWEKTIGDSKNDEAYQIIQSSDNHFVIVGYTQPKDRYDLDLFLIKLNPSGNVLWQKTYGTDQVEVGYAITEDNNGDFYVVGKAQTPLASSQVWVLKINKNGNIIWEKKYGQKNHDLGKSIFITKDSHIVVGGSMEGTVTGFNHAYKLVLDKNGNIISENTYGGDQFEKEVSAKDLATGAFNISKGEVCNKIISSRNGGYLFVGNTITKAKADLATDGWIVRLSPSNEIIWDKNIGAVGGDDILDILENEKGEIFTIGEYYDKPNGRMDVWLTKFDKNGNVLFEKKYGTKNFNSGKSAIAMENNEILISGFVSEKPISNYKTVLVDSLSDVTIEKMVTDGYQKFSSKNKEGNWVTILQKKVPLTSEQKKIRTDRDIWLGKINANGDLAWEKTFGGNDDDEVFSIIKDQRGDFILAGYTRSKGNGRKDIWILKLGSP